MFSVFDSVTGVYDRPFLALNDASAVRSFTDLAKDKNTMVGMHPEHYSLHFVGVWDDGKAEITLQGNKRCLARGHEVIAQKLEAVENA
jgi:hypothetical protein